MSDDALPGVARRVVAVGISLLLVTTAGAAIPLAGATPPEAEPNDSQSAAQSISFGEQVTGEVKTGDDEDWYAIDVEAGESINVTVTGTGGKPFVQLRSPGGKIEGGKIGNGKYVSGGETKHLGAVAKKDTTFYVRVYYTTGSYSFEAQRVSNDDYEFNHNKGNATSIELGQNVEGRLTTNDQDWYAIDLEKGQSIRYEISGPSAEAYQIYAEFRNDSQTITAEGNAVSSAGYIGTDETKSFGAVVPRSGTYYVHVYYGRGDYSLTVEAVPNDPEEPNERQATATPLFENPFPTVSQRLSFNDKDWLYFPASADETISLEASMPSDASGQVYAVVRNRSAALKREDTDDDLGGYARPDEPVSVSGKAKTSGRHYLVVYYGKGTGEETYNYTLRVGDERYGPPNDRFEVPNPPAGNQDRDSATPIESGTYEDLGIVDDDRDVFAVDLSAGERVRAGIDFAHAENDLALALVDGSGTTVQQSDSGTDGERLGFTAPAEGTYYLQVTGESGASATYDMELTVLRRLDVTLGPGGAAIPPGTTTTFNVTVSNATAGLTRANLTLTSTNTSVLTIRSVEAAGTGSVSADVAGDGGTATATVTGIDADPGEAVTVATVTVETRANGSATLTGNATLTASGGLVYPPGTVQETGVTVRPGEIRTTTRTASDDTGDDESGDGTDEGTTTTTTATGSDGGEGTDQGATTTGESGPGFGVAVALVALLGAGLVALRRDQG